MYTMNNVYNGISIRNLRDEVHVDLNKEQYNEEMENIFIDSDTHIVDNTIEIK